MRDLAKLIRELMAEHHVSERELARVTGQNRITLHKRLNGETDFSLSSAEKSLRVFGRRLIIVKVKEPTS